MSTTERARDRGRRQARRLLASLGAELRDARLTAGADQAHVGRSSGLTQSRVSRTERAWGEAPRVDELGTHAAALGLRLSLKLYPDGSPVRDAGQLRLLERLRNEIGDRFRWRSEVPVAGYGDLRAWDVVLGGSLQIGIDAETRLHDVQALQRRLELKWRDSNVDRLVLLVAGTRRNRRILREHRPALASTLPLESRAVLAALRRGEAPASNGILIL